MTEVLIWIGVIWAGAIAVFIAGWWAWASMMKRLGYWEDEGPAGGPWSPK